MTVHPTDFNDAALREWWRAVYASGLHTDTPFQSWEWNAAWWECFGASDSHRSLLLFKGVTDAGSIAFVAPLFLQRRRIGPATIWAHILWIGHELSPYPDIVTPDGGGGRFFEIVRAYCARRYPRVWLELRDVFPWSTVAQDVTPMHLRRTPGAIYLRMSFPDTPAAVPDVVRPSLRRSLRKALAEVQQRPGYSWSMTNGGADNDATLERLSRARFGERSFFADESNARFFAMIARGLRHEMRYAILERDGVPLHIIMGFYHRNIFYYFLAGMEPTESGTAPGLANFGMLIEGLMREGASGLDFLRGNERYKRDLGGREEHSEHWRIVPPAARLPHKAASVLRAARKMLAKRGGD